MEREGGDEQKAVTTGNQADLLDEGVNESTEKLSSFSYMLRFYHLYFGEKIPFMPTLILQYAVEYCYFSLIHMSNGVTLPYLVIIIFSN